jgi:hypothetical protein
MKVTEQDKTTSRGLRLRAGLWAELDKLAVGDRRKTTQYVTLVLEDHVKSKTEKKKA